MLTLDLDRLKAIANFLEGQIGVTQKPGGAGIVAMNDEEAGYVVDALREYVLRELALGNDRAIEWDTLRGFYRRHAMAPKREPACLVCERRMPATKVRPKELPGICVCDVCWAKARTEDLNVTTDASGRAIAVSRLDEFGRPLIVLWRYQVPEKIKREERVHDFDD